MLETGLKGRTFSAIDVVFNDLNVVQVSNLVERIAGVIGAAIVDDDDLFRDGQSVDAIDDFQNSFGFVVDGNHNRQFGPRACEGLHGMLNQLFDSREPHGCFEGGIAEALLGGWLRGALLLGT